MIRHLRMTEIAETELRICLDHQERQMEMPRHIRSLILYIIFYNKPFQP